MISILTSVLYLLHNRQHKMCFLKRKTFMKHDQINTAGKPKPKLKLIKYTDVRVAFPCSHP